MPLFGSAWEHKLPRRHQPSVITGLYNLTIAKKNHGKRGQYMPKLESKVEGPALPYSRPD